MFNSNHHAIYQNWAVQSNIWPHYEGLASILHPKYFCHCRLNRQWFGPIVFLTAQREGLCWLPLCRSPLTPPQVSDITLLSREIGGREDSKYAVPPIPCAVRPDWWTQAKAGTTNPSITSLLLLEGIKHSSCLNQVMNTFNLPFGKRQMLMLHAWLK